MRKGVILMKYMVTVRFREFKTMVDANDFKDAITVTDKQLDGNSKMSGSGMEYVERAGYTVNLVRGRMLRHYEDDERD